MNAPRSSKVRHLAAVCIAVGAMTCASPAVSQSPDVATPSTAGSIFVNLLVQKRDIYVGESVPVVIQVGAQDDVVASLDSPPTLRGDAFTLNVLSGDPEREQRVIDGKPCTLLAWRSLLAAVKPGTLSLTIEAPLTVRIAAPQQPSANYADESTGDPYSDPAFQSLLQTTTAQAIVVSSQPLFFRVLALPTEDQPAGFSGAVGSFKISSELSKDRTVVGEPLTLRMRVLGTGNFDRVNSAMLGSSADWKIYRPSAAFTPAENTGYRGEKLFEQAVIATQPGMRQLPALEFSYFDPQTRRYEIARTAPLSVEVAPAPAAPPIAARPVAAPPIAARTSPTDTNPHAAAAAVHPLARGDHTVRTATTGSLVPLYLRPRFLGVPLLLFLAFGGVWFTRAHRNALRTTRAARVPELSPEASLRQMRAAAAAGDSAQFFRSASRALRQAGVIDHDAEVNEILLLVDEANYSGEPPRGADLQRCCRVVLRCLANRKSC